MKKRDTETMICFLYRMSMYIHPINRDTVVSFMHGIDLGMKKEPQWTS